MENSERNARLDRFLVHKKRKASPRQRLAITIVSTSTILSAERGKRTTI